MFRIFGRLWYVDNKDVLEELKVTDKLCDELLKKLDAQRQRDMHYSERVTVYRGCSYIFVGIKTEPQSRKKHRL